MGKNDHVIKDDRHLKLLMEIHDTYRAKNHDYGDSFSNLYKEYGIISPMIKLEDKMARLRTLVKKEALVKNESIEDTLLDLANYAIMTVIERRQESGFYNDSMNILFDYGSLPKVVAVDFDGTLVKGASFPEIGTLDKNLVWELWSGKYKDYAKILYTNRSGEALKEALDFLDREGLIFDAINDNIPEVKDALNGGPIRKLWFDVLIDDKAVSPEFSVEGEGEVREW